MIFPILKVENILQVDDKTRLDATKTFITGNELVTNVEIEPFDGSGFISVYNDGDSSKWHIDWAYEAAGDKVPSVRVTTDLPDTKTKTFATTVITEAEDFLYSNDDDFAPYEPTIDRHLPRGKSSFIYAHREAQTKILEYLDEQRIWKIDHEPFTKEDITNREQFRRWSLFQALLIIFEGSQLAVGDLFKEKAEGYEQDMFSARKRSALSLDFDGDGTDEKFDMFTTGMKRR